MNNVLCRTLNKCGLESDKMNMDITQYEEAYATAPIDVVGSANAAEEELHVLFESAISNRLLAMREQMDRISGPLPYTQSRSYETEAQRIVVKQPKGLLMFHSSWQRTLLYGSLGLMLAMIGFDLMGLLVLCTR